ncbi:MAG: oxidoreductase [Caulobacterales bacterium]|nr:oxidoreductase [Caulobacterales bacterium]
MPDTYKAILADETDGVFQARLVELTDSALPPEPVLVDVAYSTLNYKDGLAISAQSPIRIPQVLPMVCGIDLAGTVRESADPAWRPGDRVLVNGFGLSERHWGGFAQRARLKPEWLVRVPEALSLEQAMALGTAGYTAMLCVLAVEDHGVKPGDGPILVTGASGGVGSVAVMLLAAMGHEVVACTGRVEESRAFLEGLGAARLIERSQLARDSRPLESETWAGVVDCVGGQVLATALAQTRYDGVVAMTGLTGGVALNTTVMPFILRSLTLRGIDSVLAPNERRTRAWTRLAELVDPARLAEIYQVAGLADVPGLADQILGGRIRGRVVIDVNA